jgi:hypothetical protein
LAASAAVHKHHAATAARPACHARHAPLLLASRRGAAAPLRTHRAHAAVKRRCRDRMSLREEGGGANAHARTHARTHLRLSARSGSGRQTCSRPPKSCGTAPPFAAQPATSQALLSRHFRVLRIVRRALRTHSRQRRHQPVHTGRSGSRDAAVRAAARPADGWRRAEMTSFAAPSCAELSWRRTAALQHAETRAQRAQ